MDVYGAYGKELILDLHGCNVENFTREYIERYFIEICKRVDMKRCDLHWWDDLDTPEAEKQTEPHLVGTSAIQFITTSNITIHTLPLLQKCFINLFSCKEFDAGFVAVFSATWFGGKIANRHTIERL